MLSIIIPAYNEENRISQTLKEYLEFFKYAEIIVVNDGSQDKTEKIVKQFQQSYKNLKLISQENQGKGQAILAGFKSANRDIIAFVDADNATTPEQLAKILKSMDYFDVAIGSRYLPESVLDRKRTFNEQLGSKAFNLLIKLILGLNFKDTQCGAKVFKKHVIDAVLPNIVMSKWAFDVSLIYSAKKQGFKLREVPIKWFSKQGSKFNMFKNAPEMFKDLLKIRFK